MLQPSSTFSPSSWRSAPTLPAIVFLLCLALSVAAAWDKKTKINTAAEVQFQRSTLRVVTEIDARLGQSIDGLNGLKAVYATRQKVKRHEFRTAVESLNLAKYFPGVRGFGFIEQVTRAKLGSFITAERADGAPEFAIRQLIDKERNDLLVIKFIEPASANLSALGLDVDSELERRTAAQQAVDTGEPTVTRTIALVQDQKETPGVLI